MRLSREQELPLAAPAATRSVAAKSARESPVDASLSRPGETRGSATAEYRGIGLPGIRSSRALPTPCGSQVAALPVRRRPLEAVSTTTLGCAGLTARPATPMPISGFSEWGGLDFRMLDLIATVVACCEGPRGVGPGHPPAETVRVLATLRRFLREGTPWRSLKATADMVSGSTLRRALERWARTGLLAQVHALLVAMLRGDPTLILDSCSVRAKRAGDRTGPNPMDRATRGTKYHVAVTGDGIPVACAATAANVNDTQVFERLFLAAFAVMARIATVFADRGYDAKANRDLCRSFGAEPHIHKRRQPSGSGLGKRRWHVERSNAWLLENKRLALL